MNRCLVNGDEAEQQYFFDELDSDEEKTRSQAAHLEGYNKKAKPEDYDDDGNLRRRCDQIAIELGNARQKRARVEVGSTASSSQDTAPSAIYALRGAPKRSDGSSALDVAIADTQRSWRPSEGLTTDHSRPPQPQQRGKRKGSGKGKQNQNKHCKGQKSVGKRY